MSRNESAIFELQDKQEKMQTIERLNEIINNLICMVEYFPPKTSEIMINHNILIILTNLHAIVRIQQ